MASVSKQFVSAGAYLLQRKGMLTLDEPLSKYLPDYVHAHEMTLSQVLTMRSGIPADDEKCEAPVDGKIDEASLLANLNKQKLDFEPSRYFAYSNCAYNLAGVVLVRVSKMSYDRFIEESFFQPLGMTSSYVLGSREEANFAQGYAREAKGWKTEPATRADKVFASGNLVSTPGDMQLWNRSLLNGTVLSRETLQKMFTVPTAAGPAHTHYASGWFVEPSGVIWHAGTLRTFLFWALVYGSTYSTGLSTGLINLVGRFIAVAPSSSVTLGLGAIGLGALLRDRRRSGAGLVLLLAVAALLGTMVGFHFRAQYCILLLPALALSGRVTCAGVRSASSSIANSATRTARKLMASMRNAGATPNAPIARPATAGPTIRAPLNIAELSATALPRSSRPTISTAKAWRVGMSIAFRMPITTASLPAP